MKQAKPDVDYSSGMPHSHCGPTFRSDRFYCRHFIPKPGRVGACKLVEGDIDPKFWCKLYKRIEASR